MSPFWLVRMRQWVQHPPSPARVKLVVAVVGFVVLIYLTERYVGWPDWLTTEPVGPRAPRF